MNQLNNTMDNFFEMINSVSTELLPMSEDTWMNHNKWVFDEMGRIIDTDHIVDLGCGVGLLGIYLVYAGYVKTADLYDGRPVQTQYARDLVEVLGLGDKVTVHTRFMLPNEIVGCTIVSTRFGSLLNFEEFCIGNKLITVRRTAEVEPILIRDQTLQWDIEIIQRDDGFMLELLSHDYEKLKNIFTEDRWMEEIHPRIQQYFKCFEDIPEISRIGDDDLDTDLLR